MRKAGWGLLLAGCIGSGGAHASVGGAVDDSALTTRGQAVVINVLANDSGITGAGGLRILKRPSHGSARVVGGQVQYVPVAGFRGRDQFRYMANGSSGWGTATVVVDVGDALVLQGRVVDDPIADALVTASVDGHDFTVQADGQGDYSVEMISPFGGMVSLEARGVGVQSFVRFVSVAGGFDRLADEAGADGVLTREENNQVQVTNLSTAQARLLNAANGGAPVTSDAELVVARESLDHAQLLQQAAAIKLAVDEGYPLPSGITDTLALISAPAALAQFITSVNADDPTALPDAIAAIVADPAIIAPAAANELVGSYALIADLGRRGALNTNYIQGNRLTLAVGGDGSYVTSQPNPEPSVTWSFTSGVADIVPNTPYTTTFFPFVNGVQRRAFITNVQYQLAKLFEGAGRDTLALTGTQYISFPDNPEIPPYFQTGTGTVLGIRDEGGIDPMIGADLAGTRSIWVPDGYAPTPTGNGGGAEHFTFYPNNTGQRANGLPFTWSIDALGRAEISIGRDSALLRRVSSDGRAGRGLLIEWRVGAISTARYSMSAAVDGFTFDLANGERSWRSGFYLGQSTIQPGTDFTFTLDPAGVAFQRQATGTSTFVTPAGWRISGSVLEIVSYRNGSNQPVHGCQVGVGGCRIASLRRWRPTARNGDRVYVIEELLQESASNGNPQLFSQRVNYYDEIPRPPLSAGVVDAMQPARDSRKQSVSSPNASPATPPAPRAEPARD
jgi:hypothetical protein